MTDPVVLLSTGDVTGPVSSTDGTMVLFDGTSGKKIKGNNAVVTAQGLALLDDMDAAANRATIGLNLVNNTSDMSKPVSTPQAAHIQEAIGTGAVCSFARSTAPTSWLKANGALVSRTTYAALFAAIGTTFGVGDGSTTFALPDLRGEFIRGFDDGHELDTGRIFGSGQDSENKSHGHTTTVSSDAHSHTYSGTTTTAGAHTHTDTHYYRTSGGGEVSSSITPFSGAASANNGTTTVTNNSAGSHNHSISGTTSSDSHSHTVTLANTGGGESRPTNIALLFCIKY